MSALRSSSAVRRVVAGAASLALLAALAASVAVVGRYRGELEAVSRALPWSGAAAALVGAACAAFVARRAIGGRELPAPSRVIWALVVGAVAGLVVNAVWMQPFLWVKSAVCASWTAGAVGLLLVAFTLRPGLAGGRPARVAGRIAVQACVAVVLVEIGLRGLAAAKPSQVLTLQSRGAAEFLAASRRAPHLPMWDGRTNSGGHFDDELEPRGDRPLVASISDSFGFCVVPHYFHYTTVCERLLAPLDVANFSVPRVGPPEYAVMLEHEALPLDPDLIVVHLFVGNDVKFQGVEGYVQHSWLRTLLDRDHLMLAHVPGRLWRMRREREARRASDGPPDVLPDLGPKRKTPEELVKSCPWLADPLLERPSFTEEAFFRMEFLRAIEVCGPEERYYPGFFRALERIRRLAGDVPLAFVVIPDEFQVEDDLWEAVVAHHANVPLDRDRPQRLIRAWCEARSVPFEDLLPRLRALPKHPDGRRHAYHLRDTHFNALGCQVAGEGLAALVARVLELTLPRTGPDGVGK